MQKDLNNTNYNNQESESSISGIEQLLPAKFLVETIYELPILYNFSSITFRSRIQLGTIIVLNNTYHPAMVD